MVAAPPTPTSLVYRSLVASPPSLCVGGSGSYLHLADGRHILDACAGAAVVSVGHGEPRVIKAICDQVGKLSYCHMARMTNEPAEELARKLVGHTPGGLKHAMFFSSGSEANESAIKLARQYWVEKGEPGRINIISRENSYHGNSLGAVSLTGILNRRKHFEPFLCTNITRVSSSYPYRYQHDGESDEEYNQRLADELETEIIRLGEGTVAAFFAETVGGASAGNLVATPGYFIAIRKVLDKYGILLVLDEVMCGIGRTGKMHAWEWEGITPDIQTNAKGLNGGYAALSSVICQSFIYDTIRNGSGVFANGQTFQNAPVACAAAVKVLEVIEEDGLVENCRVRGAQLREGLTKRLSTHPSVGEIRGRGLFLSIEFVADKSSKTPFPITLPISSMLDDAIFERGVAVYSGFGKGCIDGVKGDHILLSPPLSITEEEVNKVIQAVADGVEEVFARVEVKRA